MMAISKAATMKSVCIIFGMVLLSCGQTFAQGSTPLFTKVENLEKRLQAAEGKMSQLESRGAVIFSATLPRVASHIGPVDQETTLIYGNVIVNIGNAYNSATGIFTAPVSGVYYFSTFFHAGGQHPSGLELYRNNDVVFFTSDQQALGDGADNAGNAMFLQLQRGDVVYVKLPADKHIWSDLDATFSGFLVKAE